MPLDYAALDHFLSWDGEVGRSFMDRIERYEDIVRLHAPIGVDEDGTLAHIHMAESIGHATIPTAGHDLQAVVGVNAGKHTRGYAEPVTQGAKPHLIRARQPGKLLRFKVAGRVIFARQVKHPGNAADTFLTDFQGELLV